MEEKLSESFNKIQKEVRTSFGFYFLEDEYMFSFVFKLQLGSGV